MNDLRTERDKQIAEITLTTSLQIMASSEAISGLVELRKATTWWRFAKRRRLKKQIAVNSAVNAMIAVMGSIEIAKIISTPIPNYPFGTVSQKTES
jgi:hypothetical protein